MGKRESVTAERAGAIAAELLAYGSDTAKEAAAALASLADERDRLARLDREAATYVESVLCMRTHFTGEPPYVGWKGLGLALSEELDDLARLRREEAARQVASGQ